MKKIFLFVIICCSFLFAQSWNNEVTTTINEPYFYTMDMFTNSSGHHILIKRHAGDVIVYYKLNSQGEVQGDPITFTNHGFFPTITGSNEIIYALYYYSYYSDRNIRGKYSTDNGDSWDDLPNDLSIGTNECSNIDAVWDNNGVHLVYAAQDSDPNYKTYYYRLNQQFNWVDGQDVTSHQNALYGGWPSIALSSGRIHVSFVDQEFYNSLGNVFTRDKSEGQWQTPQAVLSGSNVADDAKLIVSGGYLYMIHDQWNSTTEKLDLKYKYRSLTYNTWAGGDIFNGGCAGNGSFSVCKTYNGYLQLVYYYTTYGDTPPPGIYHRSYDGQNWSGTFFLDDSWYGGQIGLTSVSNDFFVLWRNLDNSYMHYRQYDAIPLTPQNLSVTSNNNHPYLTWDFNNEPDVFDNDDAYEIQRRTRQVPGRFGNWEAIDYIAGDSKSYTDFEIILEGTGSLYQAEYRIRAKDLGNHISGWSSSVFIYFGQFGKINPNNGMRLYEYQLEQNYPNPFNPSTLINYSIKSPGLITLKVYDILGVEVAELVNEVKEAGNYSVNFNASDLPNGIYFYRIIAGNFVDTKKLILLK